MNLQKGDVGFVMHHDSWISKTLAWFMRSRWSHTFMVIDATPDGTYTIETSDLQVKIGMVENYIDDPQVEMEIWRPIGIGPSEIKTIVAQTLPLQDTLYGYLQLLSFAIRCLLARVGIKIPNFIRIGLVCDEVVLTGYTKSSIPGLSGVDPKAYQTEEAYELIVGSARFEKVLDKKVT